MLDVGRRTAICRSGHACSGRSSTKIVQLVGGGMYGFSSSKGLAADPDLMIWIRMWVGTIWMDLRNPHRPSLTLGGVNSELIDTCERTIDSLQSAGIAHSFSLTLPLPASYTLVWNTMTDPLVVSSSPGQRGVYIASYLAGWCIGSPETGMRIVHVSCSFIHLACTASWRISLFLPPPPPSSPPSFAFHNHLPC